MEGESPEDRSNAARGHKANLNNPSQSRPSHLQYLACMNISLPSIAIDTSEESKANSQRVLDKMEKDGELHYGSEDQNTSKNPNQVAGGLKA